MDHADAAPRLPAAIALLRELGAEDIDHPGGTLLAHLVRVQERLARWGARPELRLAGLCHAFYGTDGFPTALLPPAPEQDHGQNPRRRLSAVIGTEAESLVHFYAACDRSASYPRLPDPAPAYRDRFTGRTWTPTPQQCRDFAELTAANELDLAAHSPDFRTRWAADLLSLFTSFRPLLSEPAWRDCVTLLAP